MSSLVSSHFLSLLLSSEDIRIIDIKRVVLVLLNWNLVNVSHLGHLRHLLVVNLLALRIRRDLHNWLWLLIQRSVRSHHWVRSLPVDYLLHIWLLSLNIRLLVVLRHHVCNLGLRHRRRHHLLMHLLLHRLIVKGRTCFISFFAFFVNWRFLLPSHYNIRIGLGELVLASFYRVIVAVIWGFAVTYIVSYGELTLSKLFMSRFLS